MDSPKPSLADYEAAVASIKQLFSAMEQTTQLDKTIPAVTQIGGYMKLFDEHFLRSIKNVKLSIELIEFEIQHYKETKDMTCGEKALFFLKSALEDMQK